MQNSREGGCIQNQQTDTLQCQSMTHALASTAWSEVERCGGQRHRTSRCSCIPPASGRPAALGHLALHRCPRVAGLPFWPQMTRDGPWCSTLKCGRRRWRCTKGVWAERRPTSVEECITEILSRAEPERNFSYVQGPKRPVIRMLEPLDAATEYEGLVVRPSICLAASHPIQNDIQYRPAFITHFCAPITPSFVHFHGRSP